MFGPGPVDTWSIKLLQVKQRNYLPILFPVTPSDEFVQVNVCTGNTPTQEAGLAAIQMELHHLKGGPR